MTIQSVSQVCLASTSRTIGCALVTTGVASIASVCLTYLDIAANKLRDITPSPDFNELQKRCEKAFEKAFCAGSDQACSLDVTAKVSGNKSPYKCTLNVCDQMLEEIAPGDSLCDEDVCFEMDNNN